jgi:hypothetical protein
MRARAPRFRLRPTSSNSAAVDATAFLGPGSTALERISTDFAKSVVSSILEAF